MEKAHFLAPIRWQYSGEGKRSMSTLSVRPVRTGNDLRDLMPCRDLKVLTSTWKETGGQCSLCNRGVTWTNLGWAQQRELPFWKCVHLEYSISQEVMVVIWEFLITFRGTELWVSECETLFIKLGSMDQLGLLLLYQSPCSQQLEVDRVLMIVRLAT